MIHNREEEGAKIDKELIKKTDEWKALNAIWKKLPQESRKELEKEFRILIALINANIKKYSKKAVIRSDAYLDELSPETIKFVKDLILQGEPNLYHSIMAVIMPGHFSDKEKALEYYLAKYSIKRPYLQDNRDKVHEVMNLCWQRMCFKKAKPTN